MCFSMLTLQSGQAICKLGDVLGESLDPNHHVLLQALMKEIPGRIWEVQSSINIHHKALA